jgi:circadian clock protein KaiC
LVEGTPDTGKTTSAVQFLLERTAPGERGLCIALSESTAELRSAAESHGWSLAGTDAFENDAIVQLSGILAPGASGLR